MGVDFAQKYDSTGMWPIQIGSLLLVILLDFVKFKALQNYGNFLSSSKSKIDKRTVL